jgi:hypothetical protein
MTMYEFTVVLRDVPEMTFELSDALYEAGCDDCTPGSSGGVSKVDFHREAESFEAAVRSAIANVQAAGCVVERVEIEADAAMLKA